MRLKVDRDDLEHELQFLQGIAEKKKTIPILSNIHLSAEDDRLKLAATDLEVSLTTGCDAAVEEPGGVTVNSKKLFEVVRSLPEESLDLSTAEGNWVEVRSGNAFFRLVGLPVEDFPEVPSFDFEEAVKIPHELFREMIARTLFAVTQEDARYSLNGALLEMEDDTIRMVATDAHRLSLVEHPLGDLPELELRAIIPKKALAELKGLGNGEEMLFGQDEHHLYFKIRHRELASRVIEGQFPSYEKVIPQDNPLTVSFGGERMANAIRRVSLLASERSRAVRFTFTEGEVTIASSNPELGEARESVPVDYSGDELTISFNAQYVIDFLSVVTTEEVDFFLKDESSQGMLQPRSPEEGGYRYRYVVMPMRL